MNMRKRRGFVSLVRKTVVGIFIVSACCLHVRAESGRKVPTHADAAIVLAKYSGLFDRYVNADASLSECVSFLNKHGIYFGLMEVVNGTYFNKKDCARVMGQIELVLTGEAEFSVGKVKLPKGIDSWEDFCTLNGVAYVQGYEAIIRIANPAGDLND